MSWVNSTISNFSERFLTANISTLEEQIGQEKKFFVLNFFTTKHFFSLHFTIWKNYNTEINKNFKINTRHEHLLTEIRFTISKQLFNQFDQFIEKICRDNMQTGTTRHKFI